MSATSSDSSSESDDDSVHSPQESIQKSDVESSSDSESEDEDELLAGSGLGKKRLRALLDWEIVDRWDPISQEDSFIEQAIENQAKEFMRAGGLSFIAGQKKKPTNLGLWVLLSKKASRDGRTTVSPISRVAFSSRANIPHFRSVPGLVPCELSTDAIVKLDYGFLGVPPRFGSKKLTCIQLRLIKKKNASISLFRSAMRLPQL